MVVAYDTNGNIYAYNNAMFPAPYWPQSRAAASSVPTEGIIDLSGKKNLGEVTTVLTEEISENNNQGDGIIEKLHEIKTQSNQICSPCTEKE